MERIKIIIGGIYTWYISKYTSPSLESGDETIKILRPCLEAYLKNKLFKLNNKK